MSYREIFSKKNYILIRIDVYVGNLSLSLQIYLEKEREKNNIKIRQFISAVNVSNYF